MTTGKDASRRLQVNEFPGSDDHTIEDLGASAPKLKIQVIFVGANSLENANEFVQLLNSEPNGKLEHPYEGELDLYYQSSSQSYSTREQGSTLLDINFVRATKPTTIQTFKSLTTQQLTNAASLKSVDQFVKDVESATPDKINSIQNDFGELVSTMQKIADIMQKPGDDLSSIYAQIKSASSAISTIVNTPRTFANQVLVMLNGIDNQIKSITASTQENQESPLLVNTSPERIYNKELTRIEQNSTTKHLKILTTCSCINTNRYLLANADSQITTYKIETSINEVAGLIEKLNQRLDEATESAEFDSLELLDAIQELIVQVSSQVTAINEIKKNCKTTKLASPTPLLAFAQEQDAEPQSIESMNDISHPLFMSGETRYIPNV